jgi:hypothetical protein
MPRLIARATFLAVCGAACLLEAADIPRGAKISVRLDANLSSSSAWVGATFDGKLANELVVDGKTLAPAGARVRGWVTCVESAAISITLDHLATETLSHSLRTTDFTQRGKGSSPGQRGNVGIMTGDTIGGLGRTPRLPDGNLARGVPVGGSGPDAIIPAEMVVSFKVLKGMDVSPKPGPPKPD